MKTDFLKYYHPSVVVIVSIAVFLALAFLKENYTITLPTLGIATLVLTSVSTYAWKKKWLKKVFLPLFWVDDFSGRYEGVLAFQYYDENGVLHSDEMKHVKIINQNGHRITVSSFSIKNDGTKSSVSVNRGMHIEKTEDEQHFRLIYNYLNNGSTEQHFDPHFGTEVIKFIKNKDTKFLSGEYYTNRNPFQTRGEFKDLKWVSNELNHEF